MSEQTEQPAAVFAARESQHQICAVFDEDDTHGPIYTVGNHDVGLPELFFPNAPRQFIQHIATLMNILVDQFAKGLEINKETTFRTPGITFVADKLTGDAFRLAHKMCVRMAPKAKVIAIAFHEFHKTATPESRAAEAAAEAKAAKAIEQKAINKARKAESKAKAKALKEAAPTPVE
ncbi:hypothetical protein KIPB_009078, partial [Kipferlia bialata]|eukprot:g9078.t1